MELEFILVFAGMIGFYNAAEYESRDGGRSHRFLWAALSALVSAVVFAGLGLGWQGWVIAQVALFFGIGVARVLLEDRAKK